MRIHALRPQGAMLAAVLAILAFAAACMSSQPSPGASAVISPAPDAQSATPLPSAPSAAFPSAPPPVQSPVPTATAAPTAGPGTPVFVPGPFNTTPKPPDVLRRERQALIERIDDYLNRFGYRPGEQYSDVRQLSSDCEVRHDATIHPTGRGEIPLVLLSLGGPPPCTGVMIYRWDGRAWSRFMLDFGAREDMDPDIVLARQEMRAGKVELGIAWNACVHCSLEFISYRLLRLVNGQWQTVWAPADPRAWRGTHGTVKFVDGLNRFEITYSDFSPLTAYARVRPNGRQIFGAANGGPHRFFTDTWQRSGDRYRLVKTVSLPSTYKTAVEFCYALIYGYTKRAAAWTTNAALVSRARELGLVQMLRANTMASANHSDQSGSVVIIFSRDSGDLKPHFLLRMTKGNAEWLVSAVETTDLYLPP